VKKEKKKRKAGTEEEREEVKYRSRVNLSYTFVSGFLTSQSLVSSLCLGFHRTL